MVLHCTAHLAPQNIIKIRELKLLDLEAIEICNQIKLGLFELVINISAGDKVKNYIKVMAAFVDFRLTTH